MSLFNPRSLNIFEKGALVGILLGDGSLTTNTDPPKTCSIVFRSTKVEYITHLRNLFGPWTTAPVEKAKTTNTMGFATRSMAYFVEFSSFYIFAPRDFSKKTKARKKTKIVPNNIEDLLTNVSLAYWYMDDGSGNTDSKRLKIATDCFTKAEVEKLCSVLQKKFNLYCNPRKVGDNKPGQFRIVFPVSEFEKFKSIVDPFILPCFQYKLNV